MAEAPALLPPPGSSRRTSLPRVQNASPAHWRAGGERNFDEADLSVAPRTRNPQPSDQGRRAHASRRVLLFLPPHIGGCRSQSRHVPRGRRLGEPAGAPRWFGGRAGAGGQILKLAFRHASRVVSRTAPQRRPGTERQSLRVVRLRPSAGSRGRLSPRVALRATAGCCRGRETQEVVCIFPKVWS